MKNAIAHHSCGSATKADGTKLLVVAAGDNRDNRKRQLIEAADNVNTQAATWTEGELAWT